MAFISFKTKQEAEKCFDCKFNYMNNIKIDKKGYVHLLDMEDSIMAVLKGTQSTICNMCPYKEKFEKMYGKKPVDYFRNKS